MDRLARAIESHRRHPESLFAVLFLDLDRFKVASATCSATSFWSRSRSA
jgi:hypothetical protein